ncbi:MAG: hypothetical protein JST22_00690 [Bacteroidetes bacterium]|nr:hypothetical protein [Bacteroidota bacterium]
MTGTMLNRSVASLAAFLAAGILLMAHSTAQAQVAWPNGCMGVANIVNNTTCTMRLDLVDNALNVYSATVPPAGAQIVGIPNGTVFVGCNSAAGNTYAVNGAGCVTNFYLTGASCCVDVCYDPTNCRVIISNSTAAPPCRP